MSIFFSRFVIKGVFNFIFLGVDLLLKNLDTTANPCEDFHQYACGGWVKNHLSLPNSEPTWSQYDGLNYKLITTLKGTVDLFSVYYRTFSFTRISTLSTNDIQIQKFWKNPVPVLILFPLTVQEKCMQLAWT